MRFADVEALVVPFIKARTGSVPVATKVPATRPATFVRCWVNGGAAVNRVLEDVQVTVDVWAPSQPAASQLAGTIRSAFLHDAQAAMPLVRGVSEVTRPYSHPDETSERYRATYSLRVRATRT